MRPAGRLQLQRPDGDVITIGVGTQALYPNTYIKVSHPVLLRFQC